MSEKEKESLTQEGLELKYKDRMNPIEDFGLTYGDNFKYELTNFRLEVSKKIQSNVMKNKSLVQLRCK